jgi:hypothetical protein
MFEFDDKLSFYIPVVFPKYANKNFITEAFEDYHIGMVKKVKLVKHKQHYKAFVYFHWIENEMTRGIQKQILGKHTQTFFTFNPKIKNGYWIVKKNIESKNKKNEADECQKNGASCQKNGASCQKNGASCQNNWASCQKNEADECQNCDSLVSRNTNQKNTIESLLDELDRKNKELCQKNKELAQKDFELYEKDNELGQKDEELFKLEAELYQKDSELYALNQEHDADIEFFETKICELNQRVDLLENCAMQRDGDTEEEETETEEDYGDTEEEEEEEQQDETETEEDYGDTEEEEEQTEAEEETDEEHGEQKEALSAPLAQVEALQAQQQEEEKQSPNVAFTQFDDDEDEEVEFMLL